MITQNKTVAEKWLCKHLCRERVPPSWANTNGHNSNGLRTVTMPEDVPRLSEVESLVRISIDYGVVTKS